MPKALYKRQIKELQELKKDGGKIASLGKRMINQKIKTLKVKLKVYKKTNRPKFL